MKRLPLLFLFFSLSNAAAQEKDPEPEQIGIHFEWIELDHTTANQLIRKHALRRDAADLRSELESLLDSEQATLLESAYLTTVSGQRAKVESVEEFIYPTDFEPPTISDKPAVPPIPATPTAFDVRNVGTTIEVDPVVDSDRETIRINLAPEIVGHLGDRLMYDPKVPLKELAALRQPDFYSIRVSTGITLKSGETILVSQFTPYLKKHAGKRVLLLVRAQILR